VGQALVSAQMVRTTDALHSDVSPPLASMVPTTTANGPIRTIPWRHPHPPTAPLAPVAPEPAPVPAGTSPASLAPTAGLNFEGVGDGFKGPAGTYHTTVMPGDPNGAVGPHHYFEIVNLAIAVFDRTGKPILGPLPTNTLWKGFGGLCERHNDGDGVVRYDRLADRWVVSQLAFTEGGGPFAECVAVSTSGDPTGSYARYAFPYDLFPDYPKLGVWPDAYFVTFNMFDVVGQAFEHAEVCAYDRAKMLAGQPATQQCFSPGGPEFSSLLPADLDGPRPPPLGSPNFTVGLDVNQNALDLFRFHVDWTTPANSTLTGPVVVPVTPFALACGGGGCVPQAGTGNFLDSLGDRLMFRLPYRNFGDHEALVASHSVQVKHSSNTTGERWYELRDPNGAPTVFQQGTYAPDSKFRFMGSAAMDRDGNIGLGFSISSSATHPGIHFTGHRVTDPLGVMGQGEGTLIDGTGSNTSVGRWGDYSSLSVDPTDDCTFWYTNQYQTTDGTAFHTRNGTFRVSACQSGTAALTAVGASQSAFEGGRSLTGTVLLSTFAPSGGASVTLSSSNTKLVRVPAKVTVPAGRSSATFAIASSKTPAQATVTITARYRGASKTSRLTVLAFPVPVSVTFAPSVVPAGLSATGTVTLDSPAPSSGAVVTLASDLPGTVQVPASMTIAAGALTGTFTAASSLVAFAPDRVAVFASFHGITQTGFLDVARNLPVGNAVFDPELLAPACRTPGPSCDTGGLIDGRDVLGPESNAPNTVHGACVDGSAGKYRTASTLDRLRVSTLDGSALAPGKTVKVEATLFSCNCNIDGTGPDFVAFYVARDATDPSWSPIAVLQSPAPGRQVLSTTFTLPSGSLEAIRGSLNFLQFGAVCSATGTTSEGTDESDDLVFAVQSDGAALGYAWPEAEDGTVSSPLQIGQDFLASNEHFIQVAPGNSSLDAPPPTGHATLPFTVAVSGTYALWGRVIAASTSANSFWVRIDGGPFVKWDDIALGFVWHWDRVRDSDQGGAPLSFDLVAGNHTAEIAYRKDGTELDRLLLTNDPLFVPSGSDETGPPSAPTGVLAFTGPKEVTLFWSSSGTAASEFKVRRGTTPGGPYPTVFESLGSGFRDESITPGTRFCYVIQGSNGDGDSPPSAEVCSAPP
jgi:hypothetical protein